MNASADLTGDLKSLYQETILDHGRNPRNFRVVEDPTCSATGNNPMCGDKISVTAVVDDDGTIVDLAFDGKGCAISIASASMMSEALIGKSVEEFRLLTDIVKRICSGECDLESAKAKTNEKLNKEIESLVSLSGVSQFPVRIKCATLPWQALDSCLAGQALTTTEE